MEYGNLGFGGGAASKDRMRSRKPDLRRPAQGVNVAPAPGGAAVDGSAGSNPYLAAQTQAIISQSNQNLQNNILPSINSGAMAAGGYGGSRQGIAQGLAIQGQQQSLNSALASMYGSAYQNDQGLANQLSIANVGAAAQRYASNKSAETAARGQDLNYQLGMAQNATTLNGQNLNYGLGMAQNATNANGQLMNFYTNQRQLDQSGLRLGADLTTLSNAGYLDQGNGLYNLGLTSQNAAWTPYSNMTGVSSPYTGFGTSTQTQNGSAAAGGLGGAIGAAQLYNLFK